MPTKPAAKKTPATAAKKTAATAAKKTPAAELPILSFASRRDFAAWLADNHQRSRGIWLKLAKKGSGVDSVTYDEAVLESLVWGFIDGQGRSLDEKFWLQRFTPRGPRSIWSKRNRDKALALIAEGTMQPSGLAEVERAKQDGRWDRAYDPPSEATVPEDLAAALAAAPDAAAFFEKLNSANRYAVLFRVQTAHKPETRARRIAQLVAMLGRGEKLH